MDLKKEKNNVILFTAYSRKKSLDLEFSKKNYIQKNFLNAYQCVDSIKNQLQMLKRIQGQIKLIEKNT